MEYKDRHLLIVDDEEELLAKLASFLSRNGFTNISTAKNKSEALYLLQRESVDLALLDIMLPDGNGFEILQELRQKSSIPVIFLTALDGRKERYEGFMGGGDDYIVKPFHPEDLLLRLIALLRRAYPEESFEPATLAAASIDFSKGLILREDKVFEMTAKEYNILKLLYENANRIVTIDGILEGVWGAEYFGYENTLMTHIRRIREKLEPNPSSPVMLLTVRGLGYKLITKAE